MMNERESLNNRADGVADREKDNVSDNKTNNNNNNKNLAHSNKDAFKEEEEEERKDRNEGTQKISPPPPSDTNIAMDKDPHALWEHLTGTRLARSVTVVQNSDGGGGDSTSTNGATTKFNAMKKTMNQRHGAATTNSTTTVEEEEEGRVGAGADAQINTRTTAATAFGSAPATVAETTTSTDALVEQEEPGHPGAVRVDGPGFRRQSSSQYSEPVSVVSSEVAAEVPLQQDPNASTATTLNPSNNNNIVPIAVPVDETPQARNTQRHSNPAVNNNNTTTGLPHGEIVVAEPDWDASGRKKRRRLLIAGLILLTIVVGTLVGVLVNNANGSTNNGDDDSDATDLAAWGNTICPGALGPFGVGSILEGQIDHWTPPPTPTTDSKDNHESMLSLSLDPVALCSSHYANSNYKQESTATTPIANTSPRWYRHVGTGAPVKAYTCQTDCTATSSPSVNSLVCTDPDLLVDTQIMVLTKRSSSSSTQEWVVQDDCTVVQASKYAQTTSSSSSDLWQCVVVNNDSCGRQSSVAWDTVAGQTYWIVVTGAGVGRFVLTMAASTPTAATTTTTTTTNPAGTNSHDECQVAVGPLLPAMTTTTMTTVAATTIMQVTKPYMTNSHDDLVPARPPVCNGVELPLGTHLDGTVVRHNWYYTWGTSVRSGRRLSFCQPTNNVFNQSTNLVAMSMAIYDGACSRLSCLVGVHNLVRGRLPPCVGSAAGEEQASTNDPAETTSFLSAPGISWQTQSGRLYYIAVVVNMFQSNNSSSSIGYGMALSDFDAVSNDRCQDAILLDTALDQPAYIQGSTRFATLSTDEQTTMPLCSSGIATRSTGSRDDAGVFYRITGSGTAMRASVCSDSDGDTLSDDGFFHLEVFEKSCGELACVQAFVGKTICQVRWLSKAGASYYIYVTSAVGSGDFNLTVEGFEVAVNDVCPDAIELTPHNSNITLGSTSNARVNDDELSRAESIGVFCFLRLEEFLGPAVWYKVQGTGKTMLASTCNDATNYDTGISIARGESCQDLVCIDSNDGDYTCSSGSQSTVVFNTEVGRTYYIVVHGFPTGSVRVFPPVGEFGLLVREIGGADNDFCEDAIWVVPSQDTIVRGSTQDALMDDIESCSGSLDSPGVFYKVSGTGASFELSVLYLESDFAAAVSVYVGDCNNLQCVGQYGRLKEFLDASFLSSAQWDTGLGLTYYIHISGLYDIRGRFGFRLMEVLELPTWPEDGCRTASIPLSLYDLEPVFGSGSMTSRDLNAPSCSGLDTAGVWFKVINLTEDVILASTCHQDTNFDASISLYSGDDCSSLSCLLPYYFDCQEGISGSTIGWNAEAGETYYLLVDTTEPDQTFYLSTSTDEGPTNDGCSKALPILPSEVIEGDTVYGDYAFDLSVVFRPICVDEFYLSTGLWYEVEGNGGVLTATACSDSQSATARVFVYSNSCDFLQCVAYSRYTDGCETVEWNSVDGLLYKLFVHASVSEASVIFQLALGASPPGPSRSLFVTDKEESSLERTKAKTDTTRVAPLNDGSRAFVAKLEDSDSKNVAIKAAPKLEVLLPPGLTTASIARTAIWLGSSLPVALERHNRNEKLDISLANSLYERNLATQGASGDDCNSTIEIALDQESEFVGTTRDRSVSFAPVCPGSYRAHSPDIWLKVNGNGKVIVASTCSSFTNFDTYLQVYEAPALLANQCSNLSCIKSDNTMEFDVQGNSECSLTAFSPSRRQWQSKVGSSYFIRLFGFDEGASGEFGLQVRSLEPVPNDDCNVAELIGQQSSLILGSTSNATSDPNVLPCGGYYELRDVRLLMPGVWYKVISERQTVYRASTCGEHTNFDTHLSVLKGSSCDALACVVRNDDYGGCGTQSLVTWLGEPNVTYFIHVQGYWARNRVGEFGLTVKKLSPATNNLCGDASLLEPMETVFGSTLNATNDKDIPFCFLPVEESSVWYKVAGTGGGLRVSTCNEYTDYDTRLAVFSGTCGKLTCIDANSDDSSCGSFRDSSTVYWRSDVGEQYFVLVYGAPRESGNFALTLDSVEIAENDSCMKASPIDTADVEESSSISGSTMLASLEPFAPRCESRLRSPGVWYSILGNGGRLKASTCDSRTDFPAAISVYVGTCTRLSCVAVEPNEDCSFGGIYSWMTEKDVEYLVLVHGYVDDVGNYSISFGEVKPPGNDKLDGAERLTLVSGKTAAVGSFASAFRNDLPACMEHDFDLNPRGLWYTISLQPGRTIRVSTCTYATEVSSAVRVFVENSGGLECVPVYEKTNACELGRTIEWTTTADTVYIFAYAAAKEQLGKMGMTVQEYVPPPNDRCEGAIETDMNQTLFGSTLNASLFDPHVLSCQSFEMEDAGVWYRYTAPTATGLEVQMANADGSSNWDVAVMMGNSCEELACVELTRTGRSAWKAVAGVTYYMFVHSDAIFEVRLSTHDFPTNDDCTGAIVVDVTPEGTIPEVEIGYTDQALSDRGAAPDCVALAQAPGLWYRVIGTGGILVASTCHDVTNYDTIISVYAGSECGPLTLQCVGGNDDNCLQGGGRSQAGWLSFVNQTYYILVHGYGFVSGRFGLTVEEMPSQ